MYTSITLEVGFFISCYDHFNFLVSMYCSSTIALLQFITLGRIYEFDNLEDYIVCKNACFSWQSIHNVLAFIGLDLLSVDG